MKIIGLTGGIGSGKSTIAKCLQIMGYPVYSADEEARRLTNSHPSIIEGLYKMFGEAIYVNGSLNRKEVAARVFSDPELLKKINALIHPIVKNDFDLWCDNKNHLSYVFQESAILFEQANQARFFKTILVVSPLKLRIERVMKRDGVTEQEVMNRVNSQLVDDKKIDLADFVIHCDEKQLVLPQILAIIKHLEE